MRVREAAADAIANLCNDIVLNGVQQEAFVVGYNSVMDAAIVKLLGREWKKTMNRKVSIELKKNPHGALRGKDIFTL